MPDTALVLLIPSLEMGGTERQLVLLTRGIAELDPALADRTLLVTMRRGGVLEQQLPPGFRTASLDVRRLLAPTGLLRLVRLVRRERPTVVYSLLTPANLLCAAASLFVKSRWVWGHRSQHYSMDASALSHRIVGALLHLGARRCDAIIVNSDAAAGYFRQIGVRSTPILVIRNAIDPIEFAFDAAARRAARDELGVVDSEELLLSVGRLVADKDHPTLLRAFAQIAEVRPKARLILVGGGSEEAAAQLRLQATELGIEGRFALLGVRHDMNRWYNAADLLVQSSSNEGLSNVLLEAAATGCPIVSTDCGDASRMLSRSNLAGVGDAHALAAAAIRALSDRASERSSGSPAATPLDVAESTLAFAGLEPNMKPIRDTRL